MRLQSILAAAAMAATLTGCYTYPVYQPTPIARLTPAQSAALTQQQPLTQQQRDQLAKDNAQVSRDDQAAQAYAYTVPAAPVYYDAPYYAYPYAYGYPYYGAWGYPWYPGVSLSLGFGGRFGGHYGGHYGGYRGGFHGGGRHR